MNYTIVSMQDFASNQVIDIVKNGSIYAVYFTDKETLYTTNYRTIDEAQKVFITIANYFIHGVYTFEQRAKILKKEVDSNE